jgi:hypothetical protein
VRQNGLRSGGSLDLETCTVYLVSFDFGVVFKRVKVKVKCLGVRR